MDLSGIRSGRYFDSQQTSFGWHQDHESYYEIQNHHDLTLNFFIPISKPLRNKGNISIIPWDVLARTSPEASAALVGHGGTTFKALGRKTLATDDRGIVSLLPYDVGDISETPELDVGDLLPLRGDVIHRTQDTETNRVAFSIRLVNPGTRLQRRVLLDGGIRKTRMMARNWEDFGPLVRAFITNGKDTLTWGEVQEAVAASQGRPTLANQAAVYLFLLKQKLCVGVLGSSVGSALGGIGAKLYQRAMRWRGDQSQASGRLS